MFSKDKKILFNPVSWMKWVVPMLLVTAITTAQLFPLWIETIYSTGWYLNISQLLRTVTGWLPFSFGDIIYILAGTLLLIKAIKTITAIIRKEANWQWAVSGFLRVVRLFMWIYIVFNVLWGLNYSRLGITYQLRLSRYEYCKEDLIQLTNELIQKVNECRREIRDTTLPQPSLTAIFDEAEHCYQTVSKGFPFLSYNNPSVKSSLYSPLGNYLGFTGYYNPFTGEAQVRNDIPRVLIPFITCHEMAHQLGYASETEANFAGYLTASSSSNVYFRYSVYLDLFDYSQREEIKAYIIDRDTTGLKNVLLQNRRNLDTLVKMDRKKIREFFFKRQNNISPVASTIYDQYLKMNKQLAGINSYDEVIGWLLSYQRKYGKL